MSERDSTSHIARWCLLLGAAFLIVIGLLMAGLGLWLATLGGSWYYLLAGLASVASGVAAVYYRARLAVVMMAGVVAGTWVWSMWEIHAKGWMHSWGFDLAGRTGVLTGLLALMTLGLFLQRRRQGRARDPVLAAAVGIVLLVPLTLMFSGNASDNAERFAEARPENQRLTIQGGTRPPRRDPASLGRAAMPGGPEEWSAYGASNLGQRYSTANQINPSNVGQLEQVWEFNTRDGQPTERVPYAFENTPLKIDDLLYVCTPSAQVFALDAGTGETSWHFDPQVPPEAMEHSFSATCRSVAYHEQPMDQGQTCARRIMVGTLDSRLIALDARTGEPCPDFGQQGVLNVGEGMGNQALGLSANNSGPTVVGDRVILGQHVSDNQRRDAPSGVVRAFDVFTGEFLWAWDARRTDRPQEPLEEGEVWPRGTPNVWSVISADEELGLVFLATGNAANDHWGGDRTPEDERFTSALVAVDAATGETRWHFSTVNHDLWDYDLGAQPTIVDMIIGGTARRVVLQATKTGFLYAFDAATGEPLTPIEEREVPQGAAPGDWVAETQPVSRFYPNFGARPGPEPETISERHIFGLTPIDALACRIHFHHIRYEGIFTPPTAQGQGMLMVPGALGGINWGGISVNPDEQIAIINNSRLANRIQLIPRDEVEDPPAGEGVSAADQSVLPQAQAPYGVIRPAWLSFIGVPCLGPPWGYLSAVDLRTGKMLWNQPLGTGFDTGPLGLPTFIKIRIGTPNMGGSINTAGGLTFIAATQDHFLRAFHTRTGELLWEGRLPAAAQATPMTYMHEGRQYVVIAAGGHAQMATAMGDTLRVFALPDQTEEQQ